MNQEKHKLIIQNQIIRYLYDSKLTKEYVMSKEEQKGNNKYSILVDEMFKAMFVGESKKKNVCTLLSLIFDISYDELYRNIQSYNSELTKNSVYDKGSRSDLVTKIYDEIVHIEVNNNDSVDTMKRNAYYAFRLSADKVKSGQNYEFQPVFSININNFAFEELNKVVDVFTIQNNEGITMLNNVIFIQIYLPNLRRKWYTNRETELSELEKFLLTSIESDVDIAYEISKGDERLENLLSDLLKMSKEERIVSAYDKRLAEIEQATRDGIEQGIEKGIEQNKLEVVKKMLEENIDVKTIIKITELPEEDIFAIKKDLEVEE